MGGYATQPPEQAVFRQQCGLVAEWHAIYTAVCLQCALLAVSLQTVEAGLGKIKPTLDNAGRSLGLSPLGVLQRLHLPLMKGSLLTAILLVFVDVLKELPATLILRPFNFQYAGCVEALLITTTYKPDSCSKVASSGLRNIRTSTTSNSRTSVRLLTITINCSENSASPREFWYAACTYFLCVLSKPMR